MLTRCESPMASGEIRQRSSGDGGQVFYLAVFHELVEAADGVLGEVG